MIRRRPERDLERAVAGMARLHPDDVEAILDSLEPHERRRVQALLAGPDAAETIAEPAPAQEPKWAYEGVSPWLLDRIDPEGKAGRRPGRGFVLMTPASTEALRTAAAPFRADTNGKGRRGPALLARALDLIGGTRP